MKECNTTTAGKFRIPDLSSRFIWGCGSNGKTQGSDIDGTGYNYTGQGGLSSYKLSGAQSGIQNHSHTASGSSTSAGSHTHDIYGYGSWEDDGNGGHMVEVSQYSKNNGNSQYYGDNNPYWLYTKSSGSHSHTISVTVNDKTASASESHENKPPFIVLAYIIRIK